MKNLNNRRIERREGEIMVDLNIDKGKIVGIHKKMFSLELRRQ